MSKNEIIAMILAGGQGSRLKPLTKKIAKPAVPYGGKYRIIDFPLSNCVNSGIETVGVLTQYEPFALHKHIGVGVPWDLDRKNGGVSLLSPYTNQEGGAWYAGTANAIYQNIEYIDSHNPENVLILSGDHIYKMDYGKMFEFHVEKAADATIAVINVSLEEAKRFGMMNTREDSTIYEFEEKPENPKGTLASMGIYIFNWQLLRAALIEDHQDKESEHDFGKNIIPKLIDGGKKLVAYPFSGYWKDVGTIKSLWEANMDLLDDDNELNLLDYTWRIYTPQKAYPPQYVGEEAVIKNSMAVEGCEILGELEESILFEGVIVAEEAKVIKSVIMSDCEIGSGAHIEKAIIGRNVKIKPGVTIKGGSEIIVVENQQEITADIIEEVN